MSIICQYKRGQIRTFVNPARQPKLGGKYVQSVYTFWREISPDAFQSSVTVLVFKHKEEKIETGPNGDYVIGCLK